MTKQIKLSEEVTVEVKGILKRDTIFGVATVEKNEERVGVLHFIWNRKYPVPMVQKKSSSVFLEEGKKERWIEILTRIVEWEDFGVEAPKAPEKERKAPEKRESEKEVEKIQKEVTISGHTREVKVNILKDKLTGYVGQAYFAWGSGHKLPYVKLKGVEITPKVRGMVAAFVEAAIKGDDPKPPIKKEKEPENSLENYKKGDVSGVPFWIWKNHKEWNLCAGSYWRKTRVKPESKKIAKEWGPVCKDCNSRTTCEGPCSTSASDVNLSKTDDKA